MSTEQRENLDATLRQNAFPFDSDVSEQRRLLKELASAQPLPPGVVPAPGTVMAGLAATNRFGFMTMERDGARWRLVAHDVRGAPMTSCILFERRATCEPATP